MGVRICSCRWPYRCSNVVYHRPLGKAHFLDGRLAFIDDSSVSSSSSSNDVTKVESNMDMHGNNLLSQYFERFLQLFVNSENVIFLNPQISIRV